MTRRAWAVLLAGIAGCAHQTASTPGAAAAAPVPGASAPASRADGLGATTQLVVVITASWDTTGGMLHRYERAAMGDAWRPVGDAMPVRVGRAGVAWDDDFAHPAGQPVKREGDGRAPAGLFPIDTAFGFARGAEAAWIRLPYAQLAPGSECVDDGTSAYYNTIVNRDSVPRVDWNSAEKMRGIEEYRLGTTVGYNAVRPRAGRGSCIFLHVWASPTSATAGCTSMSERDLRELLAWMDRSRRPVLLQMPAAEYARLRDTWRLP